MFTVKNMPSTTQVLSAYTTFSASAMLVRTVVNEVQNLATQLLPERIQELIISKLGILIGNNASNQMTLVIDESAGYSPNQIFEAAQLYLRTRITPSVQRLNVSKFQRDKNLSVTIGKSEKIVDSFEGIELVWEMICTQGDKSSTNYEGSFTFEKVERKSFELSFDMRYKEKVLTSYLPFVNERSKVIKEGNKSVKLYALGDYDYNCDNEGGPYTSVNFEHPSTFETLAMDPSLKQELIDDLDRFVKRRDYYSRIGKAWKRGYLLYGPPGTGKSSLIAAMANYLKFDIYDLELTSLQSNSQFRNLLVSTANHSILVIEDIDCSVDLENREDEGYNQDDSQVTLSGLLNFIDGLWSSCGDERIFIFTTNHKEKLDPALLRPGRMDKHIHMSYCTSGGFKILASNYLGITNHTLFTEIENLISQVSVTPAEVAEELMRSEVADVALGGLLAFLQNKKTECKQLKDEAETGVEEKQNGSEIVSDDGGEKTERVNKRKTGKGKIHKQKKRMNKSKR